MKQNEMSPNYKQILHNIAHLSEQILALHGKKNMTEFVLHALCNTNCLNLNKAAYFINNTDFDCLKGVAGYNNSTENNYMKESAWSYPTDFQEHLTTCIFNQKVKDINQPGLKSSTMNLENTVNQLADKLSITLPAYYFWQTKYDNQGILIFERQSDSQSNTNDDKLIKNLCLLGFCPIS